MNKFNEKILIKSIKSAYESLGIVKVYHLQIRQEE
jgi:hypothetical protein